MASDTGITNRAMKLLKASSITSLTDGSNNANAVNDVFTEVREDLLRAHKWNFAKKRQKMAQTSTAPVFGFDNAYALPSDWIRTIIISDNDAEAGSPPRYSEEEIDGQGVIAANVDELWISYVYRVTDPNRMPADFRTAFAYALAVSVPGIPNLSGVRDDVLEKRAGIRLTRAKSADATGSTPERRPPGSWVTARGGLRPFVDID